MRRNKISLDYCKQILFRSSKYLGQISRYLLDLLFPVKCRFCHKLLIGEQDLPKEYNLPADFSCCSDCFQSIIPENNSCLQCGGTRFPISPNQPNCLSCRHWKVSFVSVIAYGEYKPLFRQNIRHLKYDQSGNEARFWTKILLLFRRDRLEKIHADLIIPIPMHRLRRWRRKINAPEIIAQEIGQALKIPVNNKILFRKKWTKRQALLSYMERQKNIKGSFSVKQQKRKFLFRKSSSFQNSLIQGKIILLVDDILTTGATCNEATKVLLACGALKVYVAVIARGQGQTNKLQSSNNF